MGLLVGIVTPEWHLRTRNLFESKKLVPGGICRNRQAFGGKARLDEAPKSQVNLPSWLDFPPIQQRETWKIEAGPNRAAGRIPAVQVAQEAGIGLELRSEELA